MGIYNSLDIYDPEQGEFSTYAIWWLEEKISRHLYDKGRVIRVLYTLHKRNSIIKKAELKYIQKFEKEPSLGELSLYMSISMNEIQDT